MTTTVAREPRRTSVPRVSLGMPVYNGSDFLAGGIEALLGQEFEDFELLISDNGSDDETPEIIRKYAEADPRIGCELHGTNRGAAWNYNRVMALANPRAPYFKWAAADDEHTPDYLSRTVAILDGAPDVVLAHTGTADIDEEGFRLRTYHQSVSQLVSSNPAIRIRDLVTMRHECFQVFGVVRAEAARSTRGHGSYPDADNVYLVELALRGRFLQDPEVCFLRRQHPDRSMTAYANRRDRAAWFDPGRTGRLALPSWRVGREMVRAIREAPLTASQRRACLGSLSVFIANNWQGLTGNAVRAGWEVMAGAASIGRPEPR